MKPAVGFKLPSAGVTPAPSEKRKMRDFVPVRSFFVSLPSEAILDRAKRSFLAPPCQGGVTDTRPTRSGG